MKQVLIIVGSDSDLPVMKDAAKVLEDFGINYELTISSAHRSPERTRELAEGAKSSGVKVIIAGAGMAAHLAGVIAAKFPLPVIGVPVKTKNLDGLDSLLSTLQMPPGIPVATVAVDGAQNSAFLALEILSLENKDLQKKLIEYRHKQTENIKNAV